MDILKEAFQSPEDAISYLEKLASTGEIDNDAIKDLTKRLVSARRKMFASKISPEKRSAAGKKAQVTKAQNLKDLETFKKRSSKAAAADAVSTQDRIDKNLLPLSVDDYSGGNISSKYYDRVNRAKDPGGFFTYDLRPEWKNRPVTKAIADKYWNMA